MLRREDNCDVWRDANVIEVYSTLASPVFALHGAFFQYNLNKTSHVVAHQSIS
jgi:hypothetical protein